jgi:hypothetical protein
VGATDSSSPALTATADLTITIERRLAIAKASLPQGITGQSYNGALTASGGLPPYSWSATSLPAGLSIDSSTGFITGTPLTSGKYPVTFGVTSSDNQEVEKSIHIDVVAGPLTITSQSLVAGTMGKPYSAKLSANGGNYPFIWRLAAGSKLPKGLTGRANRSVTL